jgi:hypothetical protein
MSAQRGKPRHSPTGANSNKLVYAVIGKDGRVASAYDSVGASLWYSALLSQPALQATVKYNALQLTRGTNSAGAHERTSSRGVQGEKKQMEDEMENAMVLGV